ncbi:MAG TPA: GNAT family N-acetyltransferase [Phycisphaerales bacterium]|nr:GNAT family N-acetyltransferase [Phycisphaerales bacterium]
MQQPAMRTRPAVPADCEPLAAVHYRSWMAAYRGVMADSFLATLSPEGFRSYARPRLERPDPGQAFLVAESAGAIVGFARAGPTRAVSPTGDALPDGFTRHASAELYAVYVDPPAFGTGAGAELLSASAVAMAAAGHRSMCVWVLTENTRALAWYRRRGAEPIAVAPITLAGVAYPQTALLWKDLAALTSG